MVLDIIEVSQKQAYIFSSNKLRDNIARSAQIAWVTSSDFFERICSDKYDEDKNLVYSGGGHTVLQFDSMEASVEFNKLVTRAVMDNYPEMEVFVKTLPYDDTLSPYENLKKLVSELEIKKSLRKSAFKKGSYGIEEIDRDTRKPVRAVDQEFIAPNAEQEIGFIPEGFKPVYELSDLGDSFAAIVHIDGNGMGKRVSDFQKEKGGKGADWSSFAKQLRAFSENVDNDFKTAYREMNRRVGERLNAGSVIGLNLKNSSFPVRRIITSGDDICFIAAGCIGIECARVFLEELNKRTNQSDGKSYGACAGIAIIHAKYPFFRAYELAERLCSNAKSLGASLSKDDNGACVSAIDWHIEYGEMGDDLSDIRSLYRSEDGNNLFLRPYIVSAPDRVNHVERIRQYKNFRMVEDLVSDKKTGYARSSVKELRSILRRKEDDVWYYLRYHKIADIAMESYQGIYKEIDYEKAPSGEGLEKQLFVTTADGKKRSTLFDAIEIMDCFTALD